MPGTLSSSPRAAVATAAIEPNRSSKLAAVGREMPGSDARTFTGVGAAP